jgi:hypothetical protein
MDRSVMRVTVFLVTTTESLRRSHGPKAPTEQELVI